MWSVADTLRGPYSDAEYGSVILPFTVLRRLECVMEPHREGGCGCGLVPRQPLDGLVLVGVSIGASQPRPHRHRARLAHRPLRPTTV
ncbi:type I restriction-modification system subunit M N-terminal domain-containing protein [Propionibacteriaceae bacterium Y2011]